MKRINNNSTLCIEFAEMVAVMMLEKSCTEDKAEKALRDAKNRGFSGYGFIDDPTDRRRVLLVWEDMDRKYKRMVERWLVKKVGCKHNDNEPCGCADVYGFANKEPIRKLLLVDDIKATNWLLAYKKPNGENLTPTQVQQKALWAGICNTVLTAMKDKKKHIKEALGMTVTCYLDVVCDIIVELKQMGKLEDKVSGSYCRFLRRLEDYEDRGYDALLHSNTGNQHSRKVTGDLEQLMIALYVRNDGRTNQIQVQQDYNSFINGDIALVNLKTGELLEPTQFDGSLTISPSTVNRYVNMDANRKLIDSFKLGGLDYQQKHQVHNRRHQAKMANSMASMDDYQAPFKTMDGKRSIWLYVIFDIASKAIIGCSYRAVKENKDAKDVGLVNEALKDMMQMCLRNGFGLPLELEMERHLNFQRRGSEAEPDVFTEGNVFKFIRFAKGGNSQEKLAERMLGTFKYEQLVNEEGFLGRPFAKNENYKGKKDGVEKRYEQKELLRRIKDYVAKYNATAHPDEPQLSRWAYYCQRQHADAVKYPAHMLMPYIGIKTITSIHRGDARVNNDWYKATVLPTAHTSGGVIETDAYWMPNDDGSVPEVYFFQKGKYIGTGSLIESYMNARAERTDADWEIMGKQTGRQLRQQKQLEEMKEAVEMIGSLSPNPYLFEEMGETKLVKQDYNKQALMEEEDEDDNWAAPIPNNKKRTFTI
jgi:hypothetical protein